MKFIKRFQSDATAFTCGEAYCSYSQVNVLPVFFPFILEDSQKTWEMPTQLLLPPLKGAGLVLPEHGHCRAPVTMLKKAAAPDIRKMILQMYKV